MSGGIKVVKEGAGMGTTKENEEGEDPLDDSQDEMTGGQRQDYI